MDFRKFRMAKFMKKKIKYKVKKLKPHTEKRGWLVELLKAQQLEKPVKQIHVASIKPGCVRGNHYHFKMMEWAFVFGGKSELILQNVETKEKVRFRLSSENPQVITIFPYVAHTVRNIGKEMVYLVSAQSEIYNHKKPDAVPWVIQ